MIIDEYINIKVNSNTLKHYSEKGYDVKIGNLIEIKIEDLSYGSNMKIRVKCDVCGNEKLIVYREYIKQIKKYKNYYCSKCQHIRLSESILNKYGVINISQLESIKLKKDINSKKTCLLKYGSEYYLSSNEAKCKIKKTLKNKYNVENVFQIEEIKKKSSETKLNKYGDRNYCNIEKFNDTMIKLYNDINYNNPDKYKKTCLEIYGVDNASKSNIIKNKIIETSRIKYGVDNPIQNPDIFLKNQLSGFRTKYYSDKLYYRGTYEKDFLDKCNVLNIINNIENFKGSINYIYNGDRKYFPDFFIPNLNLIIEIKSSLYYNLHINKNISKMENSISSGYKFIFIIDKNYEDFEKIIKNERNLL